MAVLPPTLMLGVIVIFILTSVHNQSYTWEVIFFGLRYFLEPSSKEIALYAKRLEELRKSKANKNRKSAAERSSSSTSEVPPLEIRRATITPVFFQHEEEFPYHRSLDHVLTCTFAYILAVCTEELITCIWPHVTLSYSVHYLTLPVIVITIFDITRISVRQSSLAICTGFAIASSLGALLTIVAGDGRLFHFDSAYRDLARWARYILLQRFAVSVMNVSRVTAWLGIIARILTGLLAAASSLCTLVPTYRHAQWDYEVLHQWYGGEDVVGRYDLPKRHKLRVFAVVVDLVMPWVVLLSFIRFGTVKPRTKGESYCTLLLIGLGLSILFKLILTRTRLQVYLDKALSAFQAFETGAQDGPMRAGHAATVAIVSRFYYLPSVAFQYIAPCCLVIVYVTLAKRGGNMSFGLRTRDEELKHLDVFFREIGGFLAWWTLFVSSVFNVSTHIMLSTLEKADVLKDPTYKPKSARRERRKYQAAAKRRDTVN